MLDTVKFIFAPLSAYSFIQIFLLGYAGNPLAALALVAFIDTTLVWWLASRASADGN